jgi:tetratricopeptide (TPR) repeat protein
LKAAVERARHAVELDPQEGACRRFLGEMLLYARNYDQAEYHARRALELNPNDADGMTSLGYILANRGHCEEGLAWIEKAMRLNPFHPPWYNYDMGLALYSVRRFEEAARAFGRIPNPGPSARARRAACYGQLGSAVEAAAEVAEVLRRRPNFSMADYIRRTVMLERPEDRDLLREGLRKAGLPE